MEIHEGLDTSGLTRQASASGGQAMTQAGVSPAPGSLRKALTAGYGMLFGQQWPAWVGGVLFGILSILLFVWEKPWSVADGVRNWGDWLLNSVDVTDTFIIDPHLYSTSVLNLGIIGGACAAALLARQFRVRGAPPWELFKGVIGGCLMGIGASLSFGCNIGGFFSATSALSLAGPMMMLGLMAGAIVGLKLLVWEVNYLTLPDWMSRPGRNGAAVPSQTWRRFQPLAGVGVLATGAILALVYDGLDYTTRAGLLMFGLIIGVIMQRTRFCFVRAFREPFMTGHADATRAVAIAIVISTLGFTYLKWADFKDWEVFVRDSFWLGSLLGGFIFGVGMSLSGGCASGSLWRAGEGHVKLWVALVCFALSASHFRVWLTESGRADRLGEAVFMPDYFGWMVAPAAVIALMGVWYVCMTWNERRQKLLLM